MIVVVVVIPFHSDEENLTDSGINIFSQQGLNQ